MNKQVIADRLVFRGVPRNFIEWGWVGDAGPGVRVYGETRAVMGLLPIGDDLDEEFADAVYDKLVMENGREASDGRDG